MKFIHFSSWWCALPLCLYIFVFSVALFFLSCVPCLSPSCHSFNNNILFGFLTEHLLFINFLSPALFARAHNFFGRATGSVVSTNKSVKLFTQTIQIARNTDWRTERTTTADAKPNVHISMWNKCFSFLLKIKSWKSIEGARVRLSERDR